jgi:ABC-type sugar transport system ATPase subunit
LNCLAGGSAWPIDAPVTQLLLGSGSSRNPSPACPRREELIDEPTTESCGTKALLFDAARVGATRWYECLLVSHKLEDVIALCDEIIVLRAGKLVGDLQMPATTKQLVTLMFGQELGTQTREPVVLGEPTVKLENVALRGKRVAVDDFSLSILAGEVIGLAGLEGRTELLIRCREECGAAGTYYVRNQEMTGTIAIFSPADCLPARLEEGLIQG